MTIRTSRRSRSRADGGAGMEAGRRRPQRLEQSGCQGQAFPERAAHQRDGAADDGPAGLDLERDVQVGLRAEALDRERGRVGHHRDAPAQRREPAVADGSGDLGFTAVQVGEDAFDRDRVGRERHGARDVAHDDPRIGDAGLAVADGDPSVERRRPDGASETNLGVGASRHACRRRQDVQHAQIQHGRRGQVERWSWRRASRPPRTVSRLSPRPHSHASTVTRPSWIDTRVVVC